MQFSTADKALYLKIVYYGPGLSGKTTNLETIHRITDPEGSQEMVSLRTREDRTLFFDLLPFDLGRLYGLNVRVKLYTVPGQIQYDTTRRQVLAGADGVVFVADSQRKQLDENVRMIRYLLNNLNDNGLDPRTIPMLFQWNKQDLPDLAPQELLESKLNWRSAPSRGAIATTGEGVMETFRDITALTMRHLAEKAPSLPDKMRAAKIQDDIAAAFAHLIGKTVAPPQSAASTPARPRREPEGRMLGDKRADSQEASRDRSVLGLDDLLSEAVHAKLEMAEELVVARADAEAPRRERKALSRLVQIAGLSTSAEPIHKMTLNAALGGLGMKAGALLLRAGKAEALKCVAVTGFASDPLNAIQTPGIGSVAAGLLDRGEPLLTHDIAGELLFGQPSGALADIKGVIALPFGPSRPPEALLLVYSTGRSRDLVDDDVEFCQLVAAVSALALRVVNAAPSGTREHVGA